MKTSILILAAGLGTRIKSQSQRFCKSFVKKYDFTHFKKAFALSDDVSVVLSHQKNALKRNFRIFSKTQILEQDLQNYPGTAGALSGFEPKMKEC